MSWTRKLAFLAVTWTVGLAVLLAGTELVLRLTDDGWGRTLRLNLVRSRAFDFRVDGLYDWERPTIRYARDRYGLRDDCGSPDRIDILTIGGSTTDQRLLAQEATFQAVLQRELQRTAGAKICVSNAGVDGHTTHGHLRAFRDWFPLIPGLKPKLLIFSVGVNDAEFTRSGPAEFESKISGFGSKVKELHVVQLGLWLRDLLRSRLQGASAHATHNREAWGPAEFTQAQLASDTPERAARNAVGFRLRLRRMLGHARAMGSEVICVTQPHSVVRLVDGQRRGFRAYFGESGAGYAYGGLDWDYALRLNNQVMREECGEGRFVDLYNAPFDRSDFYDGVHTTPSGAQKIGRQLASFIARSELMEKLGGRGSSDAAEAKSRPR